MTLDHTTLPPPDETLRAGLHGLLSSWPHAHQPVPAPEVVIRVVIDDVAYILYREPSSAEAERETLLGGLSRREKQVATLASRGLSAKAIAHELKIKPYTVDTYIRRLYSKLNIHSRAALAHVLARPPL